MKRTIKTFVLLGFLSLMLGSCDSHNGYVDLGLSVKWATCNVGARSPEEHGAYYAYDDALQLEKDGKRLPSKSEFRELIDNCTWLWTEEKGVQGYTVTSKKNGKSIFFPAAGGLDALESSVENVGEYWSNTTYDRNHPYFLHFGSDTVYTQKTWSLHDLFENSIFNENIFTGEKIPVNHRGEERSVRLVRDVE